MSIAWAIRQHPSRLLVICAILILSVGLGALIASENGTVVALTAGIAIAFIAVTRLELRNALVLYLI